MKKCSNNANTYDDPYVEMLNDTNVNIELMGDILNMEHSMINVNEIVNDSLSECETENSVDNNGHADQMSSVLDDLVCDFYDVSNECNSLAENVCNLDRSQNMCLHEENNQSEVVTLRHMYPENMIIGHLNVNSLGMKYQEIAELLKESSLDALMMSETKLDKQQKILYLN